MIVCYGEILIDSFVDGEKKEEHVGGAPFNLVMAAKKVGASVSFHGAIGNDEAGKLIEDYFKKEKLPLSGLRIVPDQKTTIAQVTLKDGERDFRFLRDPGADVFFDESSLDDIAHGDIVHLGSLMLSSEKGREFARKVVKKTKELHKLLSFDINFRSDIFKDSAEALRIYEEFYPQADIVKFSSDELALFTKENDVDKALPLLKKGPKLVLVTLGKDGSLAYFREKTLPVPSVSVHPVDTTGAGDCFFGTFLSQIDSIGLEELCAIPSLMKSALRFSNIAAALTTQKRGALSALPTYKEVEKAMQENPLTRF
jgi:fructokinase